jgi:MFS family permease
MRSTERAGERRPLELFGSPEFVALASARFVSGMTFATILIALALYVDAFDASGVLAGLLGAVYAVVRLVLVLPLSRRIDLGDSKRFLLAGLGVNVVLLGGFTLVRSLDGVLFLRGFQAVGWILLVVTGVSMVGEIAPDGERGLWIGTYNQVTSLASLCGDVVGGALLFVYGFGTTYATLGALSLASAAAVVVFVRDRSQRTTDAGREPGIATLARLLRRRAIVALVVFRFAFSFGKMAVLLFLPIYARTEFGMSALLIGGVLAGGKLTKGLLQGYVGEFADRVGRYEWFIFAGTVLYAVGTVAIPFASRAAALLAPTTVHVVGLEVTVVPAFPVLFLSYGLLGVADSLRLPTSMVLFVQEGEYYDAVAGSLSLRSVSWQFGAIAGPLLVGGLFDYASVFAGFWIAGASMVVAAFVFLYLFEPEGAPADGAA